MTGHPIKGNGTVKGADVQVKPVQHDRPTPVPPGTVAWAWEAIGARRVADGWRYPERNAAGEVTGWVRRLDSGKKLADKGAKRGLILHWPLHAAAGTSAANPILATEGVSDTVTGISFGFDTVGRCNAAGGFDELALLLKGLHVVLPLDNDGGKSAALEQAARLISVCASVRTVSVPTPHRDLREYVFKGGAGRADIEALIAKAEPLRARAPIPGLVRGGVEPRPLRTINGASVKPELIEYLWDRRIPKGKYTLLAGEPEAGKSCVMLDICARLTTGQPWPFETHRREPVGVLIGCPEDGIADTAVPRLLAAGADMRRVEFLDDADFDLNDMDRLAQFIQDKRIGLLTLDPITSYQPSGKNGNDEGDVRGMLQPLIQVLGRTGAALLASKHTKKVAAESPLKLIMGATAWAAMARSVLGAGTLENQGDEEETRVLVKMKLNVDRDPGSLVYEIYGAPHPASPSNTIAAVRWLRQDHNVRAVDVFGDGGGQGDGPKVEEAKEFLKAQLASGPVEHRLIMEAATRSGIAEKTLKRAKKRLGVVSFQVQPVGTPENPSFWRSPNGRAKP